MRRAASRWVLAVPPDFSLDAVVASHGWYQLAPFRFDPEARALETCIRLPSRRAVSIRIAPEAGRRVRVRAGRPLAASDESFVERCVARMLHVDSELGAFHALCRRRPGLRWIATRKLGRLLRSQDLYEDALKTLLTTNCTWKQTVAMVDRLVALLGPRSQAGDRAFPGPDAVVAAGARVLERDVRVGYRARAAIELAQRARDGELDSFAIRDEDSARKTIKSWHGFGDYAATALLALLGARSRPVIDSWALAQASKLHFRGAPCRQADVERIYSPFGAWAGMVAWFDLNRDHYREWPPSFGIPPAAARGEAKPPSSRRRRP